MKCKFCKSKDVVRATVKKTAKIIAVCKECDCVYEVDSHLNPIMNYSKEYIPHLKEIQKVFTTWDELTDIIPYK